MDFFYLFLLELHEFYFVTWCSIPFFHLFAMPSHPAVEAATFFLCTMTAHFRYLRFTYTNMLHPSCTCIHTYALVCVYVQTIYFHLVFVTPPFKMDFIPIILCFSKNWSNFIFVHTTKTTTTTITTTQSLNILYKDSQAISSDIAWVFTWFYCFYFLGLQRDFPTFICHPFAKVHIAIHLYIHIMFLCICESVSPVKNALSLLAMHLIRLVRTIELYEMTNFHAMHKTFLN